MIFSSLFSIVVGLGIAFYWILAWRTKQIPELQTERVRVLFHIAAEMLTGFGLIFSGMALLWQLDIAGPVFCFFSGMLLYTVIASPGYFAQQRQFVWLFIFAGIAAANLVALFFVELK